MSSYAGTSVNRQGICLALGLVASLLASTVAAQAPLDSLGRSPSAATFCPSCLPEWYRLRITLIWTQAADVDLQVQLPQSEAPYLPRVISYQSAKVDGVHGFPGRYWLDFDDEARDEKNEYVEDIFIASVYQDDENEYIEWCAQANIYDRKNTNDPIAVRLVIRPSIGAPIVCEADLESENNRVAPSEVAVQCNASTNRSIPTLLVREYPDGRVELPPNSPCADGEM